MVRNWQGHNIQDYFKQVKQAASTKNAQSSSFIMKQNGIIFLIFSGVDKKFILLHPLFSKRELENKI